LDQKQWYSTKANFNATNSTKWFALTTILQLLAVTLAIIQAVMGGLGLNAVSIITTCIAVATAWSQMRRHDELAKTYALAAQELGELESIGQTLNAADFSQLVEQVEEAISREHTMWCARRDISLRKKMQNK
jgi:biotin-(acetyl-CoA carboxylase) ligase